MHQLTAIVLLSSLSACTRWSQTDTLWQAGVTATLAADYSQTRSALDSDGIEQNPIMGPEGERVSPEVYFPVCAVLATGAAVAAPRPWRRILQLGVIGLQIHTIAGNWRAGYAVTF